MKIVIDIPEILFEKIKHRKADKRTLETVIMCGTPLPKGHGRLVDADKLWNAAYHDLDCDFYEAFNLADTIIEADAESEEKK